jgi:hypothetical protein
VTAPCLRAVFFWKKYQATACGFRENGESAVTPIFYPQSHGGDRFGD